MEISILGKGKAGMEKMVEYPRNLKIAVKFCDSIKMIKSNYAMWTRSSTD